MQYLPVSSRSRAGRWLAAVAVSLSCCAAIGQQGGAQAGPPARVAALSHVEGTVVFAPAGETEWSAAPVNRMVRRGDRLWTDPGARAEVNLGSAAVQLDSRTFVEVVTVDDDSMQAHLKGGSLVVRVRQPDSGDSFDIGTPQLAFQAARPGEYRLDVDSASGTTRVTVRSGAGRVQGSGGGVRVVRAGEQVTFAGRDLAQVAQSMGAQDAFDHWTLARNRAQDASIAARFVPRDVAGDRQFDATGTWLLVDSRWVWVPGAVSQRWPYPPGVVVLRRRVN